MRKVSKNDEKQKKIDDNKERTKNAKIDYNNDIYNTMMYILMYF